MVAAGGGGGVEKIEQRKGGRGRSVMVTPLHRSEHILPRPLQSSIAGIERALPAHK